MLHYRTREKSIQILTINPVFASDVYDRLHSYPGLESVKLLFPGSSESGFKVEDIEKLAHDTTNSSILIFDVSSLSRTRLQQAFSDIIRFNRPDFNENCYSIVIGDLPTEYIKNRKLYNNIYSYLSDIRVDFSPAVFFITPLSLYSLQEKQSTMTNPDNPFPERIPARFGKYFKEEMPSVQRVSAFFRAAEVGDDKKLKVKGKRQAVLKTLYIRMTDEDFPSMKELFLKGLTKEGYSVPGESLKVHLYPFFFEEWVSDLMRKLESV
ncbi:MAG: hypothetical protein ABSE89_04230 [Sedimentisphaerales bacterium]